MKKLTGFLVLIFVLSLFTMTAFAQDESVELTTYYPAPYGDYDGLSANRIAVGSNYAIPANNGDLVVEGNVGIGTTSPNAKLEVAGDLRVGNYTLPATDGTNGQVLQTNGNGTLSWVTPSSGQQIAVISGSKTSGDFATTSKWLHSGSV